MRRLIVTASLAALLAAPALAQVQPAPLPPSSYADDSAEAQFGRDIGRAAGSLAVAAKRAAAQARVIARQAAQEYRRGYAQGAYESANGADYGYASPPQILRSDEAVDACALAAEDEGRAYAPFARVSDIVDVDRRGEGWSIEGTLELRSAYRDARSAHHRFSCAVQGGQVADIQISDLSARR